MLPEFPELSDAQSKWNNQTIREMIRIKSPILGEIRTAVHFECPGFEIRRADGSGEESNFGSISAEIELSRTPIDQYNWEKLLVVLEQIAEKFSANQMNMLFEKLDKTTEETGNRIDANNQPFSFELLLEMLEKVDWTFDENGHWSPPTIIVPKKIFNKINSLVEASPSFKRQLNDLLQRKRDEYRRREINRKLAG